MSTFGVLMWMAAFAILAASAFGYLPFATIFLPLPMLVCAAFYDSWRESQAKKGSRQQ